MGCLDPQALEDLALGRLNAEARVACEAHIDGCPECARLVAELARLYRSGDTRDLATSPTELRPATAEPRVAASESMPPACLGRYRLEQKLGAGGMGVVFSAYDPELDRRVAIKLLHPGTFADAAEQRARLRQEAQAMAKLSHPNVVVVFDVGTAGDQIFLAAELVDGKTLSRWLRESSRSRRDILRCLIEAGQGIEAAHAAGIIHRDFKPDNVLIGSDGRARVTDFGLARTSPPSAEPSATPNTVTRTLVGTPPYMAPELWLGQRADPLSDQFAFTVTLHEALFGERPFVGESVAELAKAIASGTPRPVPRGTPGWLRRVIARGLEAEPRRRYPSMTELLCELRRDRRRPLRIGLWASGMLVAAAGLALAFGAFLQPQPAPPASVTAPPPTRAGSTLKSVAPSCSIGGVEQTWNEERRRSVAQAFASGPSALGQRVIGALDGYAQRFARAREAVCAAQVRSASVRCLDRRRLALGALIAAITPERRRLRLARAIVDRLPAPETCVEPSAGAPAEPPPASAGRVALLQAELWAARVELEFMETLKAREELARLLPAARALGYPPLIAEAELVDGLIGWARGELSSAERALVQAAGDARASEAQEVAGEAALALVDLAGAELAEPSESWVRLAGQLLPRRDPGAALRLAAASARALQASGDRLKARELLEAKLGARGSAGPAAQRIELWLGASSAALALEDPARALAAALSAVAEAERTWDSEDPGWVAVEQARARALAAEGQGEQALVRLRRAENVAFDAYGLGSEVVARCHDQTGEVLEALGRFAAAREKYARGLSTRTLIRDDNPAQWRSQLLLGSLLVREGRAAEGVRVLGRAVERLRALSRAHETALIDPLQRLARAQAEAGQLASARRSLTRAVEIVEARHGPVSPLLGGLRISQGQVRLAAGDKRGALSHLDDAHLSLQAAYGLHHPQVDRNLRQRAELAQVLGDHAYARRLEGALKKK